MRTFGGEVIETNDLGVVAEICPLYVEKTKKSDIKGFILSTGLQARRQDAGARSTVPRCYDTVR